jgi:5-methylcytosine-specific restriction endonuclease McrA
MRKVDPRQLDLFSEYGIYQRCKTCGLEKPLIEFYKSHGYYRRSCQECCKARARRPGGTGPRTRLAPGAECKACTKCGQVKPLSEFFPRANRPLGYYSRCKDCMYADNRAHYPIYYEANGTRKRAQVNAYTAEHREEANARSQLWRLTYPERYRATMRRWVVENHDKILADKREYGRLKPEVGRAARVRRRTRIRGAKICDFTAAQWTALLEEFDYACAYCNRPCTEFHLEHMQPVSRGGNHTASNIVPACGDCNMAKHDKTLFEYLRLVQGQFPRPEVKPTAAD